METPIEAGWLIIYPDYISPTKLRSVFIGFYGESEEHGHHEVFQLKWTLQLLLLAHITPDCYSFLVKTSEGISQAWTLSSDLNCSVGKATSIQGFRHTLCNHGQVTGREEL